MIQEQSETDAEFSRALDLVGDGYFIKVSGKTSGLEPGDESEHLILPFFTFCCLHLLIVLVFGIMNSWIS